ncbi:hypothetical protein COO60DRAFT_538325 [Scenedesmus sp. NREL 46B-D3]|nr:hypothetical protein COO60DRAFT_538325 [Scenedesmus sp. NREL 46B-D3]
MVQWSSFPQTCVVTSLVAQHQFAEAIMPIGVPAPVEAAPETDYTGFTDDFVAAEPEQPAAPLDNGNGSADADFFSSGPASAEAPQPPAQAQVLEADDPRTAWAAQNHAALQQREQAEAAKKVELLSAAKEYLDKVYKARTVQLDQRKKSNRENEAVAGVAEGAVPKGNTPWERVISVCNFNSEALSKDPFKEMSRLLQVVTAAE